MHSAKPNARYFLLIERLIELSIEASSLNRVSDKVYQVVHMLFLFALIAEFVETLDSLPLRHLFHFDNFVERLAMSMLMLSISTHDLPVFNQISDRPIQILQSRIIDRLVLKKHILLS